MSKKLVEKLLDAQIQESKKLEMIRRCASSLLPTQRNFVVQSLRADGRYARLLGALIDAFEDEDLAIEELLSGNPISSKIVTGCKWLYTSENRGLISENFVRYRLPSVSSSSQKRIVNKISKWVDKIKLGDELWAIIRSRSLELASMTLGACSDDLIVREVQEDPSRFTLPQMLDVLRKRFDSGLGLVKKIARAKLLAGSPIHKKELYHFILRRDFKKGCELLHLIDVKVNLGRHFVRRMLKLIPTQDFNLRLLLNLIQHVNQRALVRYASESVYTECFLEKFSRQRGCPNPTKMMAWIRPFNDVNKLRLIEAWYQREWGMRLMNLPQEVAPEFLWILNQNTLNQVATNMITIVSQCDEYTDEDLQLWQSLLPLDDDSFRRQKDRLQGESSESVRRNLYLNMLKSSTILRRPQYLERRLRFVVERSRNDYDSQTAILTHIYETMKNDHRFAFREEIWCLVQELIRLQLMMKETVHETCKNILLLCMEQVGIDRIKLLDEIMVELNKVLLRDNSSWNVKILSEKKRIYFWKSVMSFREKHVDTTDFSNEANLARHLRTFYRHLADAKEVTVKLLKDCPLTLNALTKLVCSEESSLNFYYRYEVYELIKPFLGPEVEILEVIKDRIKQREREEKETQILKEFRKSKIVTEELQALYPQIRRSKRLTHLCGRSLIHAEPGLVSKWFKMVEEDIEKDLSGKHSARSFEIRATISCPLELKSVVEALYPPEARLDVTQGDLANDAFLRRIGTLRSLRYLNDTDSASELIAHFMKGDYLKHALGVFNYHLSRQPTREVAARLTDRMLDRRSAVSARKVLVQGFFKNTLLFNETVIFDVLKKLSVREEHDNIKNEALIAIYHIVEQVGVDRVWPLLRHCLDAITIENRTCFTTTLLLKTSIDQHIAPRIDYLVQKLYAFSQTENYRKEYSEIVLKRIADNVAGLSLEFLFAILERVKSKKWSESEALGLAFHIVQHCVPRYTEPLRMHLMTFGDCERLDLLNSSALARCICVASVHNNLRNRKRVIDYLNGIFEARSPSDLREIRLLEVTRNILPLLPKERVEKDLLDALEYVTLEAVRATANNVEKFGFEIQNHLVADLKRLLQNTFPSLTNNIEWTKSFLSIFNDDFTQIDTVIFLNILSDCYVDREVVARAEAMFMGLRDDKVRVALRDFLILHA